MRETLKRTKSTGLVLSPIQKKMTETTMKDIGRMTRNQEKENLSGKMDLNKKESLRATPLNINGSFLKLYSYLKRNI